MTRARRDVAGRVVALTGAARGIGRASARALAAAGARVAVGDLDGEEAERAARETGAALGHALDVSDESSFASFLDATEERLGPLEVLVNNAGIMVVGPFADEDPVATERELAVNVIGVAHGMRLALPRMEARGGGHLVNVGSLASWVAPPGEASYTATKHAVRGLTDAVRLELRDRPIEVTCIYPGVVDTELSGGTSPGRGAALIRPEQVADAILGALRRPREEVFVPRIMGPVARLQAGLPPRPRRVLNRLLGVEQVAGGVDRDTRSAYERRATAA